jgi:integrase
MPQQLVEATAMEGLWFQTLILLWSSYAWRRSEAVERLTVAQVELNACADGEVVPRGKLRLDDSKNGEPRYVYLTRQLRPLIAASIDGKRPEEQVFTREGGSPIGDFRKRWQRVCISIGAGRMVSVEELKAQGLTLKHPRYVGITIHGLRRTGCRLLRAGIGEAAAMQISGHKDVKVFRKHYDGSDDALILGATKWLDEKYANQTAVKESVKLGQNTAQMGLTETPLTVN